MGVEKMKKIYLILVIIMLATLSIQIINIHAPLNGYHNWKSSHYIIAAEHFTEDGIAAHGLFVPRIYWTETNNYTGIAQDNLPVYPLITAGAFTLFGHSVEVARAVDICFHMLNILLLFFIVFNATKKQHLAVFSSLFYALFPITLYFSQNIQNLSTGMFFALMSVFLIQKWYKTNKIYYFAASIAFGVIGFLSYYTFGVVIPLLILLLFPFEDFIKKLFINFKEKKLQYFTISGLGILGVLGWLYNIRDLYIMHDIKMGRIYFLNPEWWLKSMVFWKENLGYVGLFAFGIGLYFYSRDKRLKNEQYMLFFLILSFAIIMSRKTWFHSYHWYPLLPFVAVAAGYFLYHIYKNTRENKKLLVTVGISSIFVLSSVAVVIPLYQFEPAPGNSVAGEYIYDHNVNGTIMYSGCWSGQVYGVLWHSHADGIAIPDNVSDIQRLEKQLNTQWMFIYNDFIGEIKLNYIESNYDLVLAEDGWSLYQIS